MPVINIQLPVVDGDSRIEVEVKINGEKRRYNYRVEIFAWEQCGQTEEKAECLKHIISNYDKDWQLKQIGCATEKNIPLMFEQRQN